MKNTCTYCEKTIVGRTDKRFCNSTCRTHYHNEKNKHGQVMLRTGLNKIKRNYSILKALVESGSKPLVTRIELDALGFSLGYGCNFLILSKGKTRCYCGEYFYEVLNNGSVRIGKESITEW
ncbi:MAG: hypothetical protein LAT76_00380 [Schleiferiaceae bacterium]|nr:hypothetical protein [Schleiferiaceae bacterium]